MLIDELRHINPLKIAIINNTGSFSYGEIISSAYIIQKKIKGLRVGLNIADIVQGAKIIIAADNCAKAVAFLSPSIPIETIKVLIQQFNSDIIVTDHNMFFEKDDFNALERIDNNVQDSVQPSQEHTDWVMSTSGTTSTPKLVVHSLKSIQRTIRKGSIEGSIPIWGLLYDYTRFAGVQVLMQSLLSGATIIQPPESITFEEQLAFLAKHGCNHLSGTPTMWRKILLSGRANTLDLQRITLGGEIADNKILQLLKLTYPNAKIRHIYASTEAGVGFSVADGKAGFPSSLLTENNYGVRLKVAEGRLWVKNELVENQYLNNNGTVSIDGWIDTGDCVSMSGDRFFFLGRESGVINVGGNKVHPEQIEGVILSHPDVQLARVYEIKNPIVGALVAADIVLEDEKPSGFTQELKTFLRSQLERYQVPVSITILENMEISNGGKIKR